VGRLEANGFKPGTCACPGSASRQSAERWPSVLDRLLGAKGRTECTATAFLSAPKKNPEHKHPAKKTLNAFTRRGYAVHVTEGQAKWHYSAGVPDRDGYSASTPAPFHDFVEEDSDA